MHLLFQALDSGVDHAVTVAVVVRLQLELYATRGGQLLYDGACLVVGSEQGVAVDGWGEEEVH